MIGSILGAVIISMATVAMLFAIKIGDNAIKNSGNYPLTLDELNMIKNTPGYTPNDIDDIQLDIESLTILKEK